MTLGRLQQAEKCVSGMLSLCLSENSHSKNGLEKKIGKALGFGALDLLGIVMFCIHFSQAQSIPTA